MGQQARSGAGVHCGRLRKPARPTEEAPTPGPAMNEGTFSDKTGI